jgi:hypothetical protein
MEAAVCVRRTLQYRDQYRPLKELGLEIQLKKFDKMDRSRAKEGTPQVLNFS